MEQRSMYRHPATLAPDPTQLDNCTITEFTCPIENNYHIKVGQ